VFRSTPLEGITRDGVRTLTASSRSVWVATSHDINRFSSAGRTVIRCFDLRAARRPSRFDVASTSHGLWRRRANIS
jgi:hypothetical protein